MKNSTAKIGKLGVNCLGTTDINMTVPGARKEQEFTVYPISRGEDARVITIQSETRFGRIDLSTGTGTVTPAHRGGAFGPHYTRALINGTMVKFDISIEDVNRIKMQIFGTTDSEAGGRTGVFSDNSGAVNVL